MRMASSKLTKSALVWVVIRSIGLVILVQVLFAVAVLEVDRNVLVLVVGVGQE